jgi:hypothetical protein
MVVTRRKRITKRITREVIAPIIRRSNAASKSSRLAVPFWAYSLKSPKCTRKQKKNKYLR